MIQDKRILTVLGSLAVFLGLFYSASALVLTQVMHARIGETIFLVCLCLIFMALRMFLTYAVKLRKELLGLAEVDDLFMRQFSPQTNRKLTYIFVAGFALVASSVIMFAIGHSRFWLLVIVSFILVVLPQRLLLLRLIELREASKQTASESGDQGVRAPMPAAKFVLKLVPTFLCLLSASLALFGGVYTSIFLHNPIYGVMGAVCSVLLILLYRRALKRFIVDVEKYAAS